jgi:hypothetical protein
MRKIRVIHFILLLAFIESFSQSNSNKTKSITRKIGYDYIPIEYLKDTTIIGLTHYLELPNKTKKKKSFTFFWNSYCIDGRYYMAVTPEQIYLYSGHENPNPSHIYWVLNINKDVLNILAKNYKKIKDLDCHSESCFDEKFSEEKYSIEECDKLRLMQVEKFTEILNSFILDPKLKIHLNQRTEPIKTMYYGYSEDQILESIPVLIENK